MKPAYQPGPKSELKQSSARQTPVHASVRFTLTPDTKVGQEHAPPKPSPAWADTQQHEQTDQPEQPEQPTLVRKNTGEHVYRALTTAKLVEQLLRKEGDAAIEIDIGGLTEEERTQLWRAPSVVGHRPSQAYINTISRASMRIAPGRGPGTPPVLSMAAMYSEQQRHSNTSSSATSGLLSPPSAGGGSHSGAGSMSGGLLSRPSGIIRCDLWTAPAADEPRGGGADDDTTDTQDDTADDSVSLVGELSPGRRVFSDDGSDLFPSGSGAPNTHDGRRLSSRNSGTPVDPSSIWRGLGGARVESVSRLRGAMAPARPPQWPAVGRPQSRWAIRALRCRRPAPAVTSPVLSATATTAT